MNEGRLQQQIEYYRARAGEYDQWFYRQGRYDRGPEVNEAWFAQMDKAQTALGRLEPFGDTLELAGGTGIWTERLAESATSLTVVDSAPEVIEINRAKVNRTDVRFLQADIFQWTPDRQYDLVFFSFWLSHVPPDRFEPFWKQVRSALKPDGRVFLIDSLFETSSTATNHVLNNPSDIVVDRKLNDGRQFQIYKVFYRADELGNKLRGLGWEATLHETERYLLYGECRPA